MTTWLFLIVHAYGQISLFEVGTGEKKWIPPETTVDGKIRVSSERAPKLNSLMGRLKLSFENRDWKSCLNLALKVKDPRMKPWAERQGLICAQAWSSQSSALNWPSVLKLLSALSKTGATLNYPPAMISSRKIWAELSVAYLDALSRRKNSSSPSKSGVDAHLNLSLKYLNWFSSSERAKLYIHLGERSFAKGQMEAAQQFFERSLGYDDSSLARARLANAAQALGVKSVASGASGGLNQSSNQINNQSMDETSREKELWNRFASTVAQGEPIPILEDGVGLLKETPGGAHSKEVSEKIYEVSTAIFDREDSKYKILRDRALSIMRNSDGPRLLSWAKSLYRSGFYPEAAALLESGNAKEFVESSSAQLFLAARSNQLAGRNGEAKDYFQIILNQHSGSPEYPESLVQMAIMALRDDEFASAVSFFERFLIQKRDPTLELTVRYLLWRALSKIDPARGLLEAKIILERFPLSYYGLLVRASQKENTLELPLGHTEARRTRVWLTSNDKQIVDLVGDLHRLGWYEEAQLELRELPEPIQPGQRMALAQVSQSLFDYVRAASNYNKATDIDSLWFHDFYIRLLYPKPYFSIVSKESDLRKINPLLALALMRQESLFNARAISSSGAIGLMQMIPPTARDVASQLGIAKLKLPDDLFDPKLNIRFCVFYLSRMIADWMGNVPLALASYNAGSTKIRRFLRARGLTPSETTRPSSDKTSSNLASDLKSELWIEELPIPETQFYVKAILRNLLVYSLLDRGRVSLQEPIWK